MSVNAIKYNIYHWDGKAPDVKRNVFFFLENNGCQVVERDKEPHSRQQKFKRYQWKSTCNGGNQNPEYIEQDGICYRVI